MALTALDILVLIAVGAGLVFGFLRGFVSELLSLFAWILAILALRYLHTPVAAAIEGPIGAGSWLLAFVLVFGTVFILGKVASRRAGARVRRSVVGPIDRILGGVFGALKGLIVVTLVFLALNFSFDLLWGQASARPLWISESRTYSLLHLSGEAIVDIVEIRRGPAARAQAQEKAAADASRAP